MGPRTWLLAALLLLAFAPASAHAQAAGVLPACPTSGSNQEFQGQPPPDGVVNGGTSGQAGYFNAQITRGLARTPACASMDYWDYDSATNTGVVRRGVNAYATPSVIRVGNEPTTVTFDIAGAGLPGPFAVGALPPCMPVASNTEIGRASCRERV